MQHHARYKVFGAAVVLGLALASCDREPPAGPSTPPPPPPPPPTTSATLVRIELIAPASIPPGESAQLTLNAVKSDGSVEAVTEGVQWSSSNRRVLEIDAAGMAKGVASGEATITASYQGRSGAKLLFVLPTGTYKLGGRITDSGLGLANVRLEIIGGTGEGLATLTNGAGDYALYGAAGRVRLHAKKEGFSNRIDEVDVTDHRTFGFEMAPERPRPDLQGTYTLTIEAGACSGSGSLPDVARRRSYSADVTQQGGQLTVRLRGADFIVAGGHGDSFSGFIHPDGRVTFTLNQQGLYYYYYYFSATSFDLLERLSASSALGVDGSVIAQDSGSGIFGTFSGGFWVTTTTTPPFRTFSATCHGGRHRFELRR
jgi:hypothetical protein